MLRYILAAGLIGSLTACDRGTPALSPITYPMRDPMEVGRLLQTTPMPHVIDLERGDKHLVLIGCEHTQDPAHPQFARISAWFAELHPQIAFNEGRQLRPGLHYESVEEAARTDGETGVNKYWCDKAAIQLRAIDLPDSMLLRTLENALAHYDRVLVTLGGDHALALEPALPLLMDRVSGAQAR